MEYDDIEKVVKELLADNGFSSSIQAASSRPQEGSSDKLAMLERQMSALQDKLGKRSDNSSYNKPGNSGNAERAMLNGKEICHKFNSAEGETSLV